MNRLNICRPAILRTIHFDLIAEEEQWKAAFSEEAIGVISQHKARMKVKRHQKRLGNQVDNDVMFKRPAVDSTLNSRRLNWGRNLNL